MNDMHIMICVVNPTPITTLNCAVSLLKMQNQLMTLGDGRRVSADLRFVETLDVALDQLYSSEAVGALIVDACVGFDEDFLFRAMTSGEPVVAGTYPLPLTDWRRIVAAAGKADTGEDAASWGNVYSLVPQNRQPDTAPHDGYVLAERTMLGLAWITRACLNNMATRHPEIVAGGGGTEGERRGTSRACFAAPGVYDGRYMHAEERFAYLLDRPIWVDTACAATLYGPAHFSGCVGLRQTLR
jgi:hypothetical protein